MTSSMETQEAIRRQALELQENIKELQKFAEQAKKKDAALKAAAARRPKAPPGGAANGMDAAASGGQPKSGRAAAAKPPAGEKFQAGFSFDSSPVGADAGGAEARDKHRERGNALFKDGKYDLAREAYSASLAAKPTHLAFANRAMALLKLRDFRAAEADCTSAIELEPSYVKAYQRRAAARAEQRNHLGAIDDLDYAVRLQPGSKALAAERAAVIDRHAAIQYHAESGAPRPAQAQDVAIRFTGDKPAAAAAAPAAAALETGAAQAPKAASDVAAAAAPVTSAAAAASPKLPPQASLAAAPGSKSALDAPSPVAPIHPLEAAAGQSSTAPAAASSAQAQQQTERAAAAGDQAAGSIPAASSLTPPGPQPTSTIAQSAPPHQNGHSGAADPSAKSRHATAPQTLPERPGSGSDSSVKMTRPATGLDLERTWRSLAGQPERQAQYLLLLRPEQLPTLLRASLTAPLLASMLPPLLSLLAEDCDADHAVDLLVALPSVPRFDVAIMSLGGPSKAALSVLWDERSRNAAAGDPRSNVKLKQRLANLKPKYHL